MLFTSLEYFLFLPLTAILYYLLNKQFRWVILLIASYFFYAFWRLDFLLIVVISTLANYGVGRLIGNAENKIVKKRYLYIGLFVNLGLLFSFKYLGFFNEELRHLFQFFDVSYTVASLDIILPVGIAFYTLQSLGYILDVYNGKREPEPHLGYYAVYISFFPLSIAGPVERSTQLLPQFRSSIPFDWVNVSTGFRLILWGLFKKIIIANYLFLLLKPILYSPELYNGGAYLVAILGAIVWLYAELSGYTDIAIGSARLLGIRLTANFKRPYFVQSITDMWKRWYISVTSWFQDYMLAPLEKRTKSSIGGYIVILITFIAIGFWYKASWNLFVFGLVHGIYIILASLTKQKRKEVMNKGFNEKSIVRRAVNGIITVLAWMFSCIFLFTESLGDAWYILGHLFNSDGVISLGEVPGIYSIHAIIIAIGTAMFLLSEMINKKALENPFDNVRFTFVRWSFYLAMMFLLISFSHPVHNEFFYY